jgi:hypothetical protein
MKVSFRFFFPLLIISVLLSESACKRKIKETVRIPKGDDNAIVAPLPPQALTLADSAILQFREMSGKMRITATINGRTQSFNAQMRWHKGKKVWMSLSLLGIEGLRAVITSDSIRWIDRINSQYLDKPYNYIASALSIDIPFEALERMLLGLPAMMDATGATFTDNGQYQEVKGAYRNTYQTSAFFSKVNNMLIEYRAEDASGQRSLLCRYGDFRPIEGKMFAFERYMKFVHKTDVVDLQVRFTEVNLASNLIYPYDVPLKFKRIE